MEDTTLEKGDGREKTQLLVRQCPALSELSVLPSTARLDGQSLLVLDDEELLLRDIERYKQRQQAPISQGRSGDQDLNGSQLSQSGGNAVKDVLDKVSIARLALMSCACKACHSPYAHKVLFFCTGPDCRLLLCVCCFGVAGRRSWGQDCPQQLGEHCTHPCVATSSPQPHSLCISCMASAVPSYSVSTSLDC